MVRRFKVDVSNLTLIPLSKVPESVVYTPWPDLFGKVPPGQALVLKEDELNPDTVRASLKRLQKRKQFMNFEVRVRGPRPKRTTYILNHGKVPSKENE